MAGRVMPVRYLHALLFVLFAATWAYCDVPPLAWMSIGSAIAVCLRWQWVKDGQ
jgi:hypothetical protein